MRNPHFKVLGWHFKLQFPHCCCLDSISRSCWGRWRLPKKMSWRFISKLRGATVSGKPKVVIFFHLNYHHPRWHVNLRSRLSTRHLLKINQTDKQTVCQACDNGAQVLRMPQYEWSMKTGVSYEEKIYQTQATKLQIYVKSIFIAWASSCSSEEKRLSNHCFMQYNV